MLSFLKKATALLLIIMLMPSCSLFSDGTLENTNINFNENDNWDISQYLGNLNNNSYWNNQSTTVNSNKNTNSSAKLPWEEKSNNNTNINSNVLPPNPYTYPTYPATGGSNSNSGKKSGDGSMSTKDWIMMILAILQMLLQNSQSKCQPDAKGAQQSQQSSCGGGQGQ